MSTLSRLSQRRVGFVTPIIVVLILVAGGLSGCSTHRVDLDGSILLETPTPDGSGQIAHPTIIDFQTEYGLEGWGGYRYWMSATPYPGANDALENPCLWVSHDGLHWMLLDGVKQPLIDAPADYRRRSIYNSDPCIVYNPLSEVIEMYYRESRGRGDEATVLLHRLDIVCVRNSSGVTQGYQIRPVAIQTPAFNRSKTVLSPSVVIDDEGNHVLFAVGTAVNGSMEIMVMQGGKSGLVFEEPILCSAPPDQQIRGPEDLPPVMPWHLSAKRELSGDGVVLLVNGQAYNGKTRARNLYWAQTSISAPTKLTYPTLKPLMESTATWQPYRSGFVPGEENSVDDARLWVNIYTTRIPQVWTVHYLEGK